MDNQMSDYIPTTEEVRNGYVGAGSEPNPYVSEDERAQFDRWLAEQERQISERAWQEGHLQGWKDMIEDCGLTRNPYWKDNG